MHLPTAFWLRAQSLVRRHGRAAFLKDLKGCPTIVDVGCGNNSPVITRKLRPDCTYIGVDVADYNQSVPPSTAANRYLLCAPEQFVSTLCELAGSADAVISSHNLEHCLEPVAVLKAMSRILRPSGRIYLSFPCEESVHFPHRRGTLNFYDDSTHREVPRLEMVLDTLSEEGVQPVYVYRRYRPVMLFLLGLMLEPLSAILGRCMPGGTTWALYGFETVVWAQKV